MGTFYVGCKVENHKDPKKVAVVPKLLVDSGSEFTWLPTDVLERIGVEPVRLSLGGTEEISDGRSAQPIEESQNSTLLDHEG